MNMHAGVSPITATRIAANSLQSYALLFANYGGSVVERFSLNLSRYTVLMIMTLGVQGCIILPVAENRHTDAWTTNRCEGTSQGVVVATSPQTSYGKTTGNKGWCYDVNETQAALERAAHQSVANAPLILFVHGRGKHPGKAFEKDLLHYLAFENNAKVAMFHWASYKGFAGYAHDAALGASDEFETFLRETKAFVNDPVGPHKGKTILLVHSMGNKVLRELTFENKNAVKLDFLDTLILTGPDVPPEEHAVWMDEVQLADNQYAMIGKRDIVLKGSQYIFNRGMRLGRCIKPPLSDAFQYVNVNGTGVNHLYYIDQGPKKGPTFGGKMKGHNGIRAFFEMALNGEKVDIDKVPGSYIDKRIAGFNVWAFGTPTNQPRTISCW